MPRRTEAGGEPPVPPDALPDPRPPGVVAQPESGVDVELQVADADGPAIAICCSVWPRAKPCDAPAGGSSPASHSGSPPHGWATAVTRKSIAQGSCGLLVERPARGRPSRAVVEHTDLAVVGDVVLLVRRHHVEAQPTGVVRGVADDVGPLEHEPHPAVRQVEAHGHLRVALVGAVPHAHPPAETRVGVEEVVVAALVVVGIRVGHVEVVVVGFESHAHDRPPPPSTSARNERYTG